MSGPDRNLMLLLLKAEPTTPAEKALWRVIALFSDNDRMSGHELRVFEIAMEGLGFSAERRRFEIEAAIQRKRDRQTLIRAEHKWMPDAPT